MTAKKRSDETVKTAVLKEALEHAAADGFTGKLLERAGAAAGADGAALMRLFPDGALSLVEAFSDSCDAQMEKRLTKMKLPEMKIRARIEAAVLARIEALRPHKEAARRAAAFLTLPPHAGLGAKLLYRSVDRMWRAAGDTSTDFNFYTKRAILAGVYSSTLMRWFTDDGEDEAVTREFLARRIDNVMQFEKFKARITQQASLLPSLGDIIAFARRPSA
jgi:ubiquinone biosynthesis protein COQ9